MEGRRPEWPSNIQEGCENQQQSVMSNRHWRRETAKDERAATSHQGNFSASLGGSTKAGTTRRAQKNSGAEQTLPRKSDPSRNRTRSHSPGLHPEAQPRSMHMEAHEINTLARAWKIDYNYRRADRREKGVKPPADSHYHTERMEQQGKTASSVHMGTPTNHPAHDHGYGLQK